MINILTLAISGTAAAVAIGSAAYCWRGARRAEARLAALRNRTGRR